MVSTWLKMVLFLLALVAGGFAMRDAASASQGAPPCHAAADHAGHHAPSAERAVDRTVAADEASQALHHHGSGRGCPTDGSCCDAFCHAVMTVSIPQADVLGVTFANYVMSNDAAQGSLAVRGPERPPRTAAI